MFRLEVLPARYGDCIWIEYGNNPVRRMLIDGGASGVYKNTLKPKLKQLSNTQSKFELLVVTHVDYDHIRGIIELSHDDSVPFEAKDVWFNGFRHLPQKDREVLAGKHGEELTDLLVKNSRSWNTHGFGGEAVVVPDNGPLPHISFPEGLTVTLMGPTISTLADLRKDWKKSCEDINITPEELDEARWEGKFKTLGDGEPTRPEPKRPNIEQLLRADFKEDPSSANGSSIAFLIEYQGFRVLLAGDAHPSTLVQAIDRLGLDKLKLDACKLPHHGSRGSVSAELVKRLDCHAYIFSSNGDQFSHPHPEAVARVIKHGGEKPKLLFNYRTEETSIWDDDALRNAYGYETSYPDKDEVGIVIERSFDQ